MLRRTYDWIMSLASSARAPNALFWVSFIESSFFPIPPDVMLIPMVLSEKAKAWIYATIATVGSVIGGLFGYALGYFFFEEIGKPILEFYGKAQDFGKFAEWFNQWGVWILIIKGMTPFPYKVLTITSGVTAMPLVEFTLASIVARAMRFYLVAGLLYLFGDPIREFVEKRLTLVTTVAVVVFILGFVAVRWLF